MNNDKMTQAVKDLMEKLEVNGKTIESITIEEEEIPESGFIGDEYFDNIAYRKVNVIQLRFTDGTEF